MALRTNTADTMALISTSARVRRHWLAAVCLGLAAAASGTIPRAAAAEELNVAVAANFLSTLQRLAPMYQKASHDHLLLSAGSSGQLYTQIQQGAPFDVLLSADQDRPARLEAEGQAVAGSRFTYAIGTLVLWTPKADAIDAAGKVLLSNRYHSLAIAAPRIAPYGAAAEQVLTALGLWVALNQSHRIVVGESIEQAWQFAATGAADLGFVAFSQVTHDGIVSGSYWMPPQSLYRPIAQDAVILTRSTRGQSAESFLHWLRRDRDAIAVIRAAGYRIAR